MTSPRIGLICAISMAFAWHLPSVRRTLDRVFRDFRYGTRQAPPPHRRTGPCQPDSYYRSRR